MDKCNLCMNYEYDEEFDCYSCTMELDQDDMEHFIRGETHECPYFQQGNEYQIVKHQM
ncbi:MAG: DUF6472 family protein [Lachnospiraceae bacterium]|nr:DUF6472 family protein [Lachnospiraceae bacterium]